MSSYWFVLIKIYHVCLILYFRVKLGSYYSSSRFFSFHSFLFLNRFPNKLAPNVPNNMLRNSLFCSFASYWNVSQLVSSINQVLQEIWCFSWYPPFLQSKLLTIFGLLSPKDAHLIQRISFEYLLCCYYC